MDGNGGKLGSRRNLQRNLRATGREGFVLTIREAESPAVDPERERRSEGNSKLVDAATTCDSRRGGQEGAERAFHSEDQSRVHPRIELGGKQPERIVDLHGNFRRGGQRDDIARLGGGQTRS